MFRKHFLHFFKKPSHWVWLSMGIFFLIAIPTSVKYTTADEHFWLPNLGEERVLDYWRELLSGDWEDTRINDKPGITLAYISGIAIPFTQELYANQKIKTDGSKIVQYEPEITKKLHFAFRLPLILFIGLFSLYFFWILKKITENEEISALSVLLILLSPVLLGISQIVNPDTLFWVFGLATLLTFIAYAKKRKNSYLFLTSIFFGLTLASKYVAVIFIPFLLFILMASYLFFHKIHVENYQNFYRLVLKDIFGYYCIIFGGITLFALMMPASIVDPKILYESTIGFPGMFPVFMASILFTALLSFDAFFFHSKLLLFFVSIFSQKIPYIEKALLGILILFSLFVFLNWLTKNSIIDLSHIPYYAKTKASFTEDNPYIIRFVMQFVPLVFALTPLTFFLLVFFWLKSFFLPTKQGFLSFILCSFFIIFYIAVVEQGLLVTVRYSILLFPLALILVSIGIIETFKGIPSLSKKHLRILSSLLFFIFISFCASFLLDFFIQVHEKNSVEFQHQIELFIGENSLFLLSIVFMFIVSIFWIGWKYGEKCFTHYKNISFSFIAMGAIFVSLISLYGAYPHFFLYTNTLLPQRYVLNNPWGYGGYEAAQYLNALPNAENLTLWANSHGVCEFFVGKCIRSQKLDTQQYPVDYFFFAHRGAIANKFEISATTVWEYFPDNRNINYVRLQKNAHQESSPFKENDSF
ncbi:MAG: phospholipid carrier-dependent glycosyltransferase [Candidatus Moranbacteria bacterium]|nr:phospholipid carrier-dependent glycosyltransferase [Candidatus Moranbacteria bacterium]